MLRPVSTFEDAFRGVAVDASNRVIAAGYALHAAPNNPSYSELALARYDMSGNLDPSFGIWGRVKAPSGQDYGIGRVLAIQGDGKILVAGNSESKTDTTDRRTGRGESAESGELDVMFGSSGWVWDTVTTAAGAKSWRGIALQADGRIVCGGYVITQGSVAITYPILGRYWQ